MDRAQDEECVNQGFLSSLQVNHLEILLKCKFGSVGLRQEQRFCILLGVAKAADLQVTLLATKS